MKTPSTIIEYPLYNVCYSRETGEEKTIRERVNIKEAIAAINKFDRMFCCQGALVKDVKRIWLIPVREVRVTEE